MQGDGVPQDDAEAARWFRRAAKRGHADAQNYLGVLHHMGRGISQGDAEAVKWYRKAAEQQNAPAQFNQGSAEAQQNLQRLGQEAGR